ncbi:MAG TPA: hypothetical protein VKU40_04935 [Thermoanaerobaculia bacterium]|nr:hypothetical protein [Thermoanaerobaculia bacterium]
MGKHRIALTVAAFAAALLLFAAPVAQACCTPCTWCTDETDPGFVCCTGIPVPGDACGHTTCGEYLCPTKKKCALAEAAPEAVASFVLEPVPAAVQPAGCQEEVLPPFLAPLADAPAEVAAE